MKILTIVGARPQFVKAAVLSRALAERRRETPGIVEDELLHTGQHYDARMSGAFFDELEIPEPAANLGIAETGHGAMTGAMLIRIEAELLARRPDRVIVVGDTNSTLAGALAAAKLDIPVAHVEAGLRSYNRRMPEEINRTLTDHLSTLLFCPSRGAVENLRAEGITAGIHLVGDVMVDALRHHVADARPPDLTGAFALATVHRQENADDPARLGAIMAALARAPLPVVLPLHPRTARAVRRHGVEVAGALRPVDPLTYLELLGYLRACRFVLTDSGGLQKEAYLLGKRCVTLRDETEWTELVAAGANRVVGADPDAIAEAMHWADAPVSVIEPIYGEGDAGRRIIDRLLRTAAPAG